MLTLRISIFYLSYKLVVYPFFFINNRTSHNAVLTKIDLKARQNLGFNKCFAFTELSTRNRSRRLKTEITLIELFITKRLCFVNIDHISVFKAKKILDKTTSQQIQIRFQIF